jgi:hypothetical protein
MMKKLVAFIMEGKSDIAMSSVTDRVEDLLKDTVKMMYPKLLYYLNYLYVQ